MDKTPALPTREARPEFEYVYHWHRIIPAMASLAIGVGAVLWFWPSAIPGSDQPVAKMTAPANTGTKPDQSVVVNLPVQINKPTAEKQAVIQASSAPVAAPSGQEPPMPASQTAGNQVADNNLHVAALKAVNEAPAPSAGMKPGQVLVVNKSVKDVALRQVIDHDPLELNKGSIGLSKKKAVKVVFSAKVDKPGEQVNYLWYLNGKLQAKVATSSTPESTTMASKFISYDAPGAWQVQMTNADGKVLAESAFTAKRIQ
jgi:hypothetical protein